MRILGLLLFLQSCAIVHHVQVGDIEHKKNHVRMPFEIKVSETGIDIQEAGNLAKSLSGNSKAGKQAEGITDFIAMFQMGPRTGKPIYNETYADSLAKSIYEKCPSGEITGLVIVREMASYPVVSGEIVKIKGYCLQEQTERKNKRKS
jgi:hypothetical protein